MKTFQTPTPSTVNVEANSAQLRIVASERSDTMVDVQPSDREDRTQTELAKMTRVEQVGEQILVIAPKPSLMSRILNSPSLDITISLPTGTTVRADLGSGNLEASGTLGECTVRTGAGDVRLGNTRTLDVRSGSGDVMVGDVAGDVMIETPSGHTQVGSATGDVTIKNGTTGPRIGSVGGDLRVRAGHGRIEADSVVGNVDVRTAHGAVVIGVVNGAGVDLKTSHGSLEVGIPDGRSVWQDLDTKHGRVASEFTPVADAPLDGGPSVRIVGRTSFGDIRIRRVGGQERQKSAM
jgi:hypothetical protein